MILAHFQTGEDLSPPGALAAAGAGAARRPRWRPPEAARDLRLHGDLRRRACRRSEAHSIESASHCHPLTPSPSCAAGSSGFLVRSVPSLHGLPSQARQCLCAVARLRSEACALPGSTGRRCVHSASPRLARLRLLNLTSSCTADSTRSPDRIILPRCRGRRGAGLPPHAPQLQGPSSTSSP